MHSMYIWLEPVLITVCVKKQDCGNPLRSVWQTTRMTAARILMSAARVCVDGSRIEGILIKILKIEQRQKGKHMETDSVRLTNRIDRYLA